MPDLNCRAHREPDMNRSQCLRHLFVGYVDASDTDLLANDLFLFLVLLRVGKKGLVFHHFLKVSENGLRLAALGAAAVSSANDMKWIFLYKIVPLSHSVQYFV